MKALRVVAPVHSRLQITSCHRTCDSLQGLRGDGRRVAGRSSSSSTITRTLVLFSALFMLATVTTALPTGAPTCAINGPAVNGLHLLGSPLRTVEFGPLSNHGLDLTIDGVVVEEGIVAIVTANQNHTIAIQRRINPFFSYEPFKGVLILAHDGGGTLDMNAALTPTLSTSMYQSVPQCRGSLVGGVTHVDRSVKDATVSPVARLFFNATAKDIKLDVNIVVANNQTHSIYFYTQYVLEFVAAPTKSPTKRPTKSPTNRPTLQPTRQPSNAPVLPPKAPMESCKIWRFLPKALCCGRVGKRLRLCRSTPVTTTATSSNV